CSSSSRQIPSPLSKPLKTAWSIGYALPKPCWKIPENSLATSPGKLGASAFPPPRDPFSAAANYRSKMLCVSTMRFTGTPCGAEISAAAPPTLSNGTDNHEHGKCRGNRHGNDPLRQAPGLLP